MDLKTSICRWDLAHCAMFVTLAASRASAQSRWVAKCGYCYVPISTVLVPLVSHGEAISSLLVRSAHLRLLKLMCRNSAVRKWWIVPQSSLAILLYVYVALAYDYLGTGLAC